MSEYRKKIDSTEELASWYNEHYAKMLDGWVTPPEECHRHLDDLGVPHDPSRTLLDVGAGAGHFLVEAQKRVTAMGIEISTQGVAYCRKRGVNVVLDSIETWIYPPQFNYIVSIGSLEHIVDLDKALDNIHNLLKQTGKFYFYAPNERWAYNDQPNERTMTDEEWMALFSKHGLRTLWSKRWGSNQDNTAFCGVRDDNQALTAPKLSRFTSINAGSGQRPFTGGFCNVDIQDKYGPDLVADFNDLHMFADNSMDYVVNHHGAEHARCGESDAFFKEAYRLLKPGGSLLVFVPDMRALCQRWLSHQMDTQLFMTNVYGAFMGDPHDQHAWGFDAKSLRETIERVATWSKVIPFDWRKIPGADIAGPDFWILSIEAVK